MIYLGWYDDNTKKKTITKIDEAIERYEYKYGISPNICLVAEQELVEHPRIQVRPARHLRPNYYYVGIDESAPTPLNPVALSEAKAA